MMILQQHDEHQTNGDIKLAFLSYNYLILHDDKAESNICFLWLPPDDKVEFYDPARLSPVPSFLRFGSHGPDGTPQCHRSAEYESPTDRTDEEQRQAQQDDG